MDAVKMMDVFAIPDKAGSESAAWPKIGIAFLNQDNSINVVLDLFPRVGKIHIRPSSLIPPRPVPDTPQPSTKAGDFLSTSRKGITKGKRL